MSLRTQWPYAAKAIVQHEWVVNLLNVWVTFKFTMDQSAKPDHDLWLCEVDGAPKAVTVSAWQDEWTILLTVPDVLALPSRVTLAYDGPSMDLRITWDKQWEAWGPILSNRVPYGWEDILVVDAVNKRVGIQPGVAAVDPFEFPLTVVSPDGSAQAGLYHNNTNLYVRTNKGGISFSTTEGVDTDLVCRFFGKGDGTSQFFIFDEGMANYWNLLAFGGRGYLNLGGASPTEFVFGSDANVPITFFRWCSESETEEVRIYGYRTGDAQRHLDIGVGVDAADTVSFDGLTNYWFDGEVDAQSKFKVAGTQVVGAQGAAVADATGAGDVVTRLNDLLARCRAHGLIAT